MTFEGTSKPNYSGFYDLGAKVQLVILGEDKKTAGDDAQLMDSRGLENQMLAALRLPLHKATRSTAKSKPFLTSPKPFCFTS